jgi:hypothetical protein
MGGLLICLYGVLVAVGASDFWKSLGRMDVRLGLLMAVRATHASRTMDGGEERFLIDMQREEGTILFPFTESRILMALQAFRVIHGLRR